MLIKIVNCQTLASRANPKVIEARSHFSYHDNSTNALSSAVKPSSFINSMFSYVRTSTTAVLDSLFRSASALLSAQQSVAHSAGSPIYSSQVDFNGTALLTDVIVRKLTGKKYSKLLEDSPLTTEKNKERELDIIEKKLEVALSECKKYYQCPGSSLSNSTISIGAYHQNLL